MGPWKSSWGRVATYLFQNFEGTSSESILRMQAAMWPIVPDRGNLCRQALKYPTMLKFLQRAFYYTVSCPEHYDGDGHLLLHIFSQIHDCKSFVDTELFTNIPSDNCLFNVLLLILVSPDEPDQPPSRLRDDVNAQCWAQLMEACGTVKSSQFEMLTLVSDLAALVSGTERSILAAEDAELIIACINKAFALPFDHRIIPTLPALTNRLRVLLDGIMDKGLRPSEDNAVAASKVNMSLGKIITYFVTNTVCGSRNVRTLSCARARQEHSPATGWLPLDVE
ncbi:hypothetical protein M408DRAFT_265251 [Serendipita vermifera MAFF 305830]|uniref:Uncharacterized protein n=1 Tax=Serendipita vermifera MAFF 305830 TaxID=933852 RepID=A0A0C2WA07_SERVB|nr:hypothetical protein M408DRAFT_265251 [Serendipita vermifera MAFF 305830]